MHEKPFSKNRNSEYSLAVWKAIIIGWITVNVPVLIIIVTTLLIGLKLAPNIWWLFLLLGVGAGWTWWSFMIPRWRRWANRRGVLPDELQKAGVAAGLVWPKGSIFEKTEIKIREP